MPIIETLMKSFEVRAFDLTPSALGLPAGFANLGDVVSAGLPLVVYTTGLLMFGYMILGGLKYITAAGDVKQTQEAVKTLTNSVVGLAIVFISFWAVRIIETVFGLQITGF